MQVPEMEDSDSFAAMLVQVDSVPDATSLGCPVKSLDLASQLGYYHVVPSACGLWSTRAPLYMFN